VKIRGPPRVGRYGVDIAGFESFLQGIRPDDPGLRLIVIDEIGKMECFSGRFRELVRECLGSQVPFLATIALRGTPAIEQVKVRSDVKVITMRREDREEKFREVMEEVRRLAGE